ncbi:MAG: energy transducer TonB [Bacteriovorax sp.]|nr:energy transducer TonB [Bacteriovorax sp.]
MPKLSFSFGAAIGIHIVVIFLSGFLIEKKDADIFSGSRNLFDIQLGNYINSPVQKAAPLKQISRVSQKNSIALNSEVSPTGTTKSAENATTLASGSASGNSFESSIITYHGPAYPRIAQVRGLQGYVRIRIKVSTEGVAQETAIVKSSGHEVLDNAALSVIPQWRFHKKDAFYFVEKNIVFQLKD